ncbi:MAG: hypothetical protein H6699_04170 [Myxococcales bacterium]|nr:hypothetical protein [Myxococcales bacterium]
MIPLTVSIRSDVARELAYAAAARPDETQAAIVLGTVHGGCLELTAYADLCGIESALAFGRGLLDAWVPLCRRVSRMRPAMSVVGWVSIRRGAGDALEPEEHIVHRTYFNLAHQVTLTLDPSTGALRCFGASRTGDLVAVPIAATPDFETHTPNNEARP